MGAGYAMRVAATHPERVRGLILIGPAVDIGTPRDPDLAREYDLPFDVPLDRDDGWAKYNAHYWRRDWMGFAEFFFGEMFNEPHSTKQIEDTVGWSLETDPEVLIAAEAVDFLDPPAAFGADGSEPNGLAFARRIACPSLVIHGTNDAIVRPAIGRHLAELLGADLVLLGGSGHAPNGSRPGQGQPVDPRVRRVAGGRPVSAMADTVRPLADDGGRARLPDRSDIAVADDGVRLAFDVYGDGEPTIVLLPSAPIVHSRQWKAQIPFLSRSYRVVAYRRPGQRPFRSPASTQPPTTTTG